MKNYPHKFSFAISIPIFNNYQDIEKLYLSFTKTKLKNYFICFVDDSNSNKALNEINKIFKKNYVIIRGPNKPNGRCAAVKKGFKWILKNINTEILIEMDSDLSYDPNDLLIPLNKKNQNYDILLGSKYQKKSRIINRSILRNFLSFIVTKLAKILFKKNISDFTNGYRIYKKNIIKKIIKKKIETDSPLENLNIVLYSIYLKANIKEFASSYNGNQTSHWSLNIISIFKLIFKTIYLFIYYFIKINFLLNNNKY